MGDKRQRPGQPGMTTSPKTQVGRDQQAFTAKRKDANKKGWDTRREKYGETGTQPKQPV